MTTYKGGKTVLLKFQMYQLNTKTQRHKGYGIATAYVSTEHEDTKFVSLSALGLFLTGKVFRLSKSS